MPGDIFSPTATTTSPVGALSGRAVGTEEVGLVDDDVAIRLDTLTLRPGTHRRISFRATPGSSVEVVVRAHEWHSMEDLDASRAPRPLAPDPSPGGGAFGPGPLAGGSAPVVATGAGATTAGSPTTAPAAGVAVGPVAGASTPGGARAAGLGPSGLPVAAVGIDVLAVGDELVDAGEVTAAVIAARRLPVGAGRLGVDRVGGGMLIDGGEIEPLPQPPSDPLPVDVLVRIRDGALLQATTQLPAPSGSGLARLTVGGINVDEVVDVVLSNPNDVAIRFTTCVLRVQRQVRTTVATLDTATVLRVFDGAISGLQPSIAIRDGELIVSFDDEAMHELGIEPLRRALPDALSSLTGGVTFTPRATRIAGLGDLIGPIIDAFVAEVRLMTMLTGGVAAPNSLTVPDDLDATVADAFFTEQPDLHGAVRAAVWGTRDAPKRWKTQLKGLLERHPVLANRMAHRRTDVAIRAGFSLTELWGTIGPVDVELDRFEATSLLALVRRGASIPAPHGHLPHDELRVGDVLPVMEISFDIGDIDVDIDVPWWLTVATGGIANIPAILVELGAGEITQGIIDQLEAHLPGMVHDFFATQTRSLGRQVTDTLTEIANRDHVFHSVAATSSRLAIATIDPAQLRVPHRPRRRPSPVAEIDQTLPPVQPIDAAPSTPPAALLGPTPSERLARIDHLVFIMMENRSFDHMLGYLSHPDHGRRTDIDGLDGTARALGSDMAGTTATPIGGAHPQFRPNLPHDHRSVVRQINDGGMDGFVSEYARKLLRSDEVNPRGLFNDPERALRFELPHIVETYDQLARDFLVCDRWFSAVPAGTYPNRSCYYSGVTPALENHDIIDEFGYLSQLTLFDVLDHVGVDWRVFESDVSFLRVFDAYRLEQDRIRPIAEMSDPLPPVTFIDPNYTGLPSSGRNNDDQPPTDVRRGQAFVADVINRIKAMSHWESTMIVVTYDEHGGFADHVPPPGAPGSSHPPTGAGPSIPLAHPDAHTYGVRVPAFIVSPHVQAGTVAHQIFDHATVFRTVLERFAPQHVNSRIIPERVRRARHLGEVLAEDPPRVAISDLTSPSSVGPPSGSIGRITVREPTDVEDMSTVLRSLGRPTRPGGLQG